MAGSRSLSWLPGVEALKDLPSGVTKRLWNYFTGDQDVVCEEDFEYDTVSSASESSHESDLWVEAVQAELVSVGNSAQDIITHVSHSSFTA